MATDFKKEGVMRAHPDPEVPEGMCIVLFDDAIFYVGPIRRSKVTPDADIYLNPVDFKNIDAFMRKRMH